MSYVSHISALLAATLVCACAKGSDGIYPKSDEQIMLVPSQSYRQNACWTHKDGSFRALLVLARGKSYAIPDFISVNCLIAENSSDSGAEIILHIGAILMVDPHRQLQRKFPDVQIRGNVASDQLFPSGKDKLYYLKADVEKIPHPYQTVYAPTKIDVLEDLNMSFEKLLKLSRGEREALLQSLE